MHVLNYFWFGPNVIPKKQLENFKKTINDHPNEQFVLWHDGQLNEDSQKYIEKELAKSKLIMVDVRTKIEKLLDSKTSPKTYDLIKKLLSSPLPSALGDILKLLILTADLKEILNLDVEQMKNQGHFYMEMDNEYTKNLEKIIDDRDLVIQIEEADYIRPDSFYVNPYSGRGQFLKENLALHLERFLENYLIDFGLNKVIIEANKKQGLNRYDICRTFGEINHTLLKTIMLPHFPNFLNENNCRDFSKHGKHAAWSWVTDQKNNIAPIDGGNNWLLINNTLHDLKDDRIFNPPDYYAGFNTRNYKLFQSFLDNNRNLAEKNDENKENIFKKYIAYIYTINNLIFFLYDKLTDLDKKICQIHFSKDTNIIKDPMKQEEKQSLIGEYYKCEEKIIKTEQLKAKYISKYHSLELESIRSRAKITDQNMTKKLIWRYGVKSITANTENIESEANGYRYQEAINNFGMQTGQWSKLNVEGKFKWRNRLYTNKL